MLLESNNANEIIENTEKSLFDLAKGEFSQSFLKFNEALDQTIEVNSSYEK